MPEIHDFIYEDKDGNTKTQEVVSIEFRAWIESLPDQRKDIAMAIYNENSNNLDQLVAEGKLERTVDNKLIWLNTVIDPSVEFQNLYDEFLTAVEMTFTIHKS